MGTKAKILKPEQLLYWKGRVDGIGEYTLTTMTAAKTRQMAEVAAEMTEAGFTKDEIKWMFGFDKKERELAALIAKFKKEEE